MQVVIDTKKDSKEEIKKVISFLNNLMGENEEIVSNDISSFDSESSNLVSSVDTTESNNAFMNMFGDQTLNSVSNGSETSVSEEKANEDSSFVESVEVSSSEQNNSESDIRESSGIELIPY